MKYLWVILLVGCVKAPNKIDTTNNPEFTVDLLFEHEGCKVYRFQDDGSKYFTNCKGSVQWSNLSGKVIKHHEINTND